MVPAASFSRSEQDGVILWVGDPDSDAAHAQIRAWLRLSGLTFFLGPVSGVGPILKGNLGEAIAFHVGRAYSFIETDCQAFPANALNPFSGIAISGVDIVWIAFSDDPELDFAVLQEVKTTGDPRLLITASLLEDYDKLFGTQIPVTLWTRLTVIKNSLKFGQHRPDLATRVLKLAGNSPSTSTRIKLIPTIIHELDGSEPRPRMGAIRTSLLGKNWLPGNVTAWAIGLSNLDGRLSRIACDMP